MGPLQNLVDMMPNLPQGVDSTDIDDRNLVRLEAIIQSMTADERANPVIIDGSRRGRIAKGSGTSAHEVSQLLKQFKEIKKLMKGPKKSNKKQRNKKNPEVKRNRGELLPEILKEKVASKFQKNWRNLLEGQAISNLTCLNSVHYLKMNREILK